MKHLVSISIGPVQSFIAAGRRPADLYAGSAILQRIAKAAAASLAASGASFIFPADLHKAAANKILVTIEGDPQKAAAAAERAAQKELESIWNEQMGKVVQALPLDKQRAHRQLESLLEFYSAWLPLAGSYEQVRKDVDQLLSARKALRNFPQIDQGDAVYPSLRSTPHMQPSSTLKTGKKQKHAPVAKKSLFVSNQASRSTQSLYSNVSTA